MNIEAVLLTGGASRRMGEDKASLEVDGVPLAAGIAQKIGALGYPVTVLGREAIEGFAFLADTEDYAGPLSALAQFQPSADFVFVSSCDMPQFDPAVIGVLKSVLEGAPEAMAAVPSLDGRLQPTCAQYRREAWSEIASLMAEGKRSLMAWLDRLRIVPLDEEALRRDGLDPEALRGANTPEALRRLLER